MDSELLEVVKMITKGDIKKEEVKENNLLGLDPTYFMSNASKRISKLKKDKNSIENIFEYLKILATTEQNDNEFTVDKFTRNTAVNESARNFVKINKVTNVLNWNPGIYFYIYQANRLPYCCGVTEYGNFQFTEYKLVDQNLVYNLIIDLIRLSANNERRQFSGAVGIINYFINTPFMNILESRDDLRIVEEFTNPKTNHKLKMFIFNTKI